MGFFDSLLGKKSSPRPPGAGTAPAAGPAPAVHAVEPPAEPSASATPGVPDALAGQQEVQVRHSPQHEIDVDDALAAAREHLERKDLPAALHLYEQVVSSGADLAGPLATISGDLGATGHIEALAEFVAPHFQPALHGAGAGLNLLQAYLHLRNDSAAQQLLDLLYGLRDPALSDRLDGFRTAVEQLRAERAEQARQAPTSAPDISLITVSKPIWTYGLEHGENALPTKHGRERRLAFLPVALVGAGIEEGRPAPADHPLAPLARGLALAISEYCWYSPEYRPLAVSGVDPQKRVFVPPRALGGEQARALFTSGDTAVTHAVGGTIRAAEGGAVAAAELVLWDVRKARVLTTLRAEGPDSVANVWRQLLAPVKLGPAPLAYTPPEDPAAHAAALDHALHFFLAEKRILPLEHLGAVGPRLAALAAYATRHAAAAVPRLILLGAVRQCLALDLAVPSDVEATVRQLEAN